MSRPRTQAERLAVTRATLLREARLIFAASGYDAAATEEIVQRAEVTRGALYYHFKDKRAVFEAIVEEVAREIAAAIDKRAEPLGDPLQALIEGTRAFLDACLNPGLGVEPVTFLLSGAFNEAALWIAEAKDEKAARREMDRTLVQLMERLFGSPAEPARPPRARARA
jgi:AcrR family transcriptional regulator